MHRDAGVSGLRAVRLSCVDPDADAEIATGNPVLVLHRALYLHGRGNRRTRGCEGDEEAVSRGVDLRSRRDAPLQLGSTLDARATPPLQTSPHPSP